MTKMFGCSDRTLVKRGYRLRAGDQVPTRPATIREVMEQPEFALGVADARAGRGYPKDFDDWTVTNEQWNYERGRQWATVAPRHVRLMINGKVTAAALRFGADIL